MSNYWKDRIQDERDNQFNHTQKEIDAEIAKQYKIVANKLRMKLRTLYNEALIDSANGTLLMSDLYKYQHYFDLLNDMNVLLRKLGQNQIAIMSKDFNTYYAEVCKLISKQHGINNHLNTEFAERAINAVWCQDGKNWSDRVWDDKAKLQQAIEEGLTECVAAGVKTDGAVKMLMEKFQTSFHNAETLVRTEMSHIQNEACLDLYESADVEEAEWLSEHNPNCCDYCAEQNHKIFNLQEARGMIPAHPNCACTWIARIKETK